MDEMQSNNSNKRREETDTNRTHMVKHSEIQISDTQGHTINIVSYNSVQTISDQGDQSDQIVTVSDK